MRSWRAAKVVEGIDATGNGETAEVQFKFSQQADIRTFREDSNYVVDVSPIDAKPNPAPAVAAAVANGQLAGRDRARNGAGTAAIRARGERGSGRRCAGRAGARRHAQGRGRSAGVRAEAVRATGAAGDSSRSARRSAMPTAR